MRHFFSVARMTWRLFWMPLGRAEALRNEVQFWSDQLDLNFESAMTAVSVGDVGEFLAARQRHKLANRRFNEAYRELGGIPK